MPVFHVRGDGALDQGNSSRVVHGGGGGRDNGEADLTGLCPVHEGHKRRRLWKILEKNIVNLGVWKHIKTSFMPLLLTGPLFFNVFFELHFYQFSTFPVQFLHSLHHHPHFIFCSDTFSNLNNLEYIKPNGSWNNKILTLHNCSKLHTENINVRIKVRLDLRKPQQVASLSTIIFCPLVIQWIFSASSFYLLFP